YAAHQLIAWQPQGVFDDNLLDQVTEWLLETEQVSPEFKRFVDLSQLKEISIRTRHLFAFVEKRKQQVANMMPVRCALFCEDWVGFGIARLYESLMENTPVEARAFRDRAGAAEWLDIPGDVLTLKDKPAI